MAGPATSLARPRDAESPSGAPREYQVEGRTVRLPVEVRDATTVFATFLVRSCAARRLFDQSEIALAEPIPGRALVSLAAVEYRDNDLGRYDEIAVAFPIRRGGARAWPIVGMPLDFARGRGGVYIHRLPVTTAFSCAAGRDIWGFPKTVAEIAFADRDGERTATLTVEGARVLALTVARGGRRRFRDAPLDAYSIAAGVVRRTPFVSSGDGVGLRLGEARLELGDHPWADELRAIGLPKRALVSGSVERLSARFAAPVAIGRAA